MATPRKPRPAPKSVEDVPEMVDLDALTDDERGVFEQTAPLFKVNGRVYEARTAFSAGEAIQYVKIARERGYDEALEYAMTQALGAEGWKAFVDCPYMSQDNSAKIVSQVMASLVGGPDPKSRKR